MPSPGVVVLSRLGHQVGAGILFRFELVETLEGLAGGVIEVRGDRDLDFGEQVAGALGGLDATPLDAQHAPRRSARGDTQPHRVAAEGGDLDGRAESRLGEGHGDRQPQVEAVTGEHR
ncbi:mRNA cap guanine-N7 methyltransferase, partial [Corchorus olitorius]